MPRVLILISLGGLLLLFPHTSAGYCLDRYPEQAEYARFDKLPVRYRVSSTLKDPKILAAIDAAFETWGSIGCSSLTFEKGAQFDPGSVDFQASTGHINIFWATQSSEIPPQLDPKYYFFHFRNFVPTGFTVGGSMAVNAATYNWTTAGADAASFDVQNVLTHYIGRMVGLKDSKTPNTVMYPDVAFGQTSKRTLTNDEIEAVRFLYPEGGCTKPPPPDVDGCRAVGNLQPPPPPGGDPPPEEPVPPAEDPPPNSDPGGGSGLCASSAECAPGDVCTVEGQCVPSGPGVFERGEDGGCAVASAPPAATPLLLLGPWGLVVIGRLRRRRADRPART